LVSVLLSTISATRPELLAALNDIWLMLGAAIGVAGAGVSTDVSTERLFEGCAGEDPPPQALSRNTRVTKKVFWRTVEISL